MRHLFFLIILLSVSACSSAEDRVTRYLNTMEASLNTSTLLYSRLSPEAAKLIKQVDIPPEAKEVAECIISKAKDDDMLAVLDKSLDMSENMMEYIRDTPTLTVLTMVSDEKFNEIQTALTSGKFKPLQEHAKECGAHEMILELTKKTGAWEAYRSSSQTQN